MLLPFEERGTLERWVLGLSLPQRMALKAKLTCMANRSWEVLKWTWENHVAWLSRPCHMVSLP